MQWTSLNELREKYLAFFESKGHLRLKSFPLIPQNDNSLLLINSGMAPMKKYFTGEITPPSKRVTTCQKCIRTPDIERVGKTARHGTFFEMMGNFSFGDYFKHDATRWAWEFCTQVMELPVDRLWVTIYQDDDEAFDIWTKEVGVAPERIVRLGKEDNFWEHGTGPCGPCSELHFDRGEEYSCGKPDCAVGCDCDRYVEFWNLVFTQFDSDGKGGYTPLDHPNIDTGMGLERLACIMQGVDNLFEVDTVANIMKHISSIAGVQYKQDEKADVSLRVITDHIRSTTFMIGDGVMPSNEGRGYVLRRLLRRAARHGRLLGIHRPFLAEAAETVINENRTAYPELTEKKDLITELIRVEEESFAKTIDQGLSMLNDLMARTTGILSGEDAFQLYDTFGFPLDLTRDILEENGREVDEEGFNLLMKQQRERARNARKKAGADAWAGDSAQLDGIGSTAFTGYEGTAGKGKVLAILMSGEPCALARDGEEAVLVLDTTAFYAESGGQAGDTGLISTDSGTFAVSATTKTGNGIILHSGKMLSGEIRLGDAVDTLVEEEARASVMRNHTSAHLLQAALRQVLGSHVQQAGQMVDPARLRFDFTHFSALTKEQLHEIEQQINRAILAGIPVDIREMPIDEARAMGAMALFGEKYGDVVRVVKAGDFSIELCGGTHVDNTAKIGLFHILSESSVASGVRRIEAVTGTHVLELLEQYHEGIITAANELKSSATPEALAAKASQVAAELKEKDREMARLRSEMAVSQLQSMLDGAAQIKSVRFITRSFEADGADAVRAMADEAKGLGSDIVALFAGIIKEKGTVTFAAVCGKEAVAAGAHAGNLVREVAKAAGGSGGGRPDSAMAGGKTADKAVVEKALAIAADVLTEQLQ